MKANWYGIAGWALMLTAALLAVFVIPFPHNGTALATLALGAAGALLITVAIGRPER